MVEELRQLATDYGAAFYLITFFWAFLEGETFLIFAGLLASQDFMHLEYLIPAAALGTTCGDFLFFCLGRRYGLRMVEKWEKLRRGKDKVAGWLERHDTLFILTYRYIYGLRNVSAIAIGMSKISAQRYFWLNFVASWIWAISFACAGYLFGDLFVGGSDPVLKITIAIIVMGGIVFGVRTYLRKRQEKEDKAIK